MPRGSDFPVSVHMRAVCSQIDCYSTLVTPFMKEVEPLLYQYAVNLYYDGHQHSFERSRQVYQNVCRSDGTGTVFVTVFV